MLCIELTASTIMLCQALILNTSYKPFCTWFQIRALWKNSNQTKHPDHLMFPLLVIICSQKPEGGLNKIR